MALLSCGGPLKCLRIIGKKATARRMNQSIEPILSLTSSTPACLSPTCLVLSSPSLPIFSSSASRSVLSWDIYSYPGPASPNRHTNPRLNIVWYSLHAFLSFRPPPPSLPSTKKKKKISRSHPHGASVTAGSASTGSLQTDPKRMTVGRKCTRMPFDPSSEALSCELRKKEKPMNNNRALLF